MYYYKSSELAEQYGVSRRTVTNWIKQASTGKLSLRIIEIDGIHYIAKSEKNQERLANIVQERRKYLNKRSHKHLHPTQTFYEMFSQDQMSDIVRSLLAERELPLQYTYFGEGARLWDKFRKDSGLLDAERLVSASSSYIMWLLSEYESVNIIDVGVGNGQAVKPLISLLQEAGKLRKYIGIDLSQNMIEITEANLRSWFPDLPIEMHVRDFSRETFGDLATQAHDPATQQSSAINVVLMLGGQMSNFKDPVPVLSLVNRSMSADDILITNFKLGIPEVKKQLAFISGYQTRAEILLNLMGVDRSLYDAEIGFDEEEKVRYSRIKFNRAITIEITTPLGSWFVPFKKDDKVLTFRAHYNEPSNILEDIFVRAGFNPLMTSQRVDHQGMLLVADTKQ